MICKLVFLDFLHFQPDACDALRYFVHCSLFLSILPIISQQQTSVKFTSVALLLLPHACLPACPLAVGAAADSLLYLISG
jgi:hypothetical protein